MLKICSLLLCFSLILQSMAEEREPTCEEHQEFKTCGTACPKNCANYFAQIDCIRMCVRGCFCVPPYVFRKGNKGPCIPFDHCPRKFLYA
ncbi:chymotrypsin-elastase inhibitor ixodidin-like [Eleutherodactylus coqui]|uniref:TIL domain-containing protein n=1 Tax=Eleutherodactylus coqui TaxID=57060 RepID=A0A8J6EDQ4_ELECQ|nr:hypothetical protein GDO78_015490 [Eleutherodactylus coqui]